MPAPVLFITGTDTGVGKTVLTALLVRHLLDQGIAARAVKPLCSGGRSDARVLARAQDGALSLNEINPWHFRAPLTPLIAARMEGRVVTRAAISRYLRAQQRQCEVLLVEGAGGMTSPLGVDFDALALITALGAMPVVVCPNRLGMLNHALLSLAVLPPKMRLRANLVLMAQRKPDASSVSNVEYLQERIGAARVVEFPYLAAAFEPARSLRHAAARSAAAAILEGIWTARPRLSLDAVLQSGSDRQVRSRNDAAHRI